MICADCELFGQIPLYDTDRGVRWGCGCRHGRDPEECEEEAKEDGEHGDDES